MPNPPHPLPHTCAPPPPPPPQNDQTSIAKYTAQLMEARRKKGITEELARDMLTDLNMFGARGGGRARGGVGWGRGWGLSCTPGVAVGGGLAGKQGVAMVGAARPPACLPGGARWAAA